MRLPLPVALAVVARLWLAASCASASRPSEGPPTQTVAPSSAANPLFKPAAPQVAELKGGKVAVVVYPVDQNTPAGLKRAALTRLEAILGDNNVTVLDREKAAELSDVFKKLDDPSAFVTAEDFVKNADKLTITALAALYINVDAVKGPADFFSATAHSDVRFISETDARVKAFATVPMGVPGMPPSDAIERNAAMVNALQRAVDNACLKMGLSIVDPATPNSVQLVLEAATPPAGVVPRTPESGGKSAGSAFASLAKLEAQTWRKEKMTGSAVAPGGGMAVVAGYIIDTDWQRRPERLYGSRLHVLDLAVGREISVLDCHAVEKKAADEPGVRQILDCLFLVNWRYVAAVTGNAVFLFDTERGRLMSKANLPRPVDAATLSFTQNADGSFLAVFSGAKLIAAHRIAVKR